MYLPLPLTRCVVRTGKTQLAVGGEKKGQVAGTELLLSFMCPYFGNEMAMGEVL